MESKGLGDTIAKFTGALKIDKLAEAVAALAGADGCGCKERKEYLNELFPYESTTRKIRILNNTKVTLPDQRVYEYLKGSIVEVKKGDPLYNYLIPLAQARQLEEI